MTSADAGRNAGLSDVEPYLRCQRCGDEIEDTHKRDWNGYCAICNAKQCSDAETQREAMRGQRP